MLGDRPAGGAAQLARVGFVAQDAPVYARPVRRRPPAPRRPAEPALGRGAGASGGSGSSAWTPRRRPARLSGGQRAQLALTVAAAKRAELLILDEPVAALDPLARRAFLRDLLEFVAELGVSVVLSSHLLGDLEQVCDHLIVLADGRVQLAGDVADLLAVHYRVTGARRVAPAARRGRGASTPSTPHESP